MIGRLIPYGDLSGAVHSEGRVDFANGTFPGELISGTRLVFLVVYIYMMVVSVLVSRVHVIYVCTGFVVDLCSQLFADKCWVLYFQNPLTTR